MSIKQSSAIINGVNLSTPPLIDPPPRVTVGPPPEKITVACVWWGTLYPVKYVENLRNMVARNLTVPYEFVCITDRDDVPEGVTKIPTPIANEVCQGKNHYGDGKGWWAKVGLHKPGLFGDAKRVLYFDLDLVIINNIDSLASVQEPYCMIENFGPNKAHSAHNSSVMVWTPSESEEAIYNKFTPQVTKELHGDQCWHWRVLHPNVHNYPKNWVVSYKYEKHPQWRHQDKDTKVIIFHGQPKPHQVKDPIIVNNWK
jgi:hypothetical protein